MISLHTVLEVSAQRLPRDQPMSLVGDAGSEAGPSYFPSTGLVVCLRLLQPPLGNLCLSSPLTRYFYQAELLCQEGREELAA